MKKTLYGLYGLLQGTIGSYFAILGICFAFPQSAKGTKEYEEDRMFMPFGFIMLAIWLAVMGFTVLKLKRDDDMRSLVTFAAAWAVGLTFYLIYAFST